MEPSANSWSPCRAANCCLWVFAVFNISLISAAANKTLASSCRETCSQFTQTVATYIPRYGLVIYQTFTYSTIDRYKN